MSDLLFFLRDYDTFIRSPSARHCYRQPIGKVRAAYWTLREALARNDLLTAGVELEHISAGAYLGDFIAAFWRRVPDSAALEINQRVTSEPAW